MSLCFLLYSMASHRHPWEVILPRSPMPIQGIIFQGLFNLNNLPLECFYSGEAHTRYYVVFRDHHIKIKRLIDLHALLDTLLPTIIHEKGWDTLLSLLRTHYLHLMQMFYVNMHSFVARVTFQVTMYGQSFLVSTLFIRCVLGIFHLAKCFPSLSPKVQSLTYKELDVLSVTLFGTSRPL